jgi:hypothetical protein
MLISVPSIGSTQIVNTSRKNPNQKTDCPNKKQILQLQAGIQDFVKMTQSSLWEITKPP